MWVYNSVTEWQEQFPFWSESTLRRIINNLRKVGLLIVADGFNRAAFDHTLWYTIDYDLLDNKRPPNRPIQDDPIDPTNPTDRSSQNDHIDTSKVNTPKRSKRTRPSAQNEQDNTRDYTETTTEIKEENNKVGTPTVALSLPVVAAVVPIVEAVTETSMPPEPEVADDSLLSKEDWDIFVKALLWVCYGHEDMDALMPNSRQELHAEAKRIVKAGYRLDDLRSWFSTKWMPRLAFKDAGIRPRPAEVRERIPITRDRDKALSLYTNYTTPMALEIPKKKDEPSSGDEAWDMMVRWHFTGSTWHEQIRDIRVVDVCEVEGTRVYEVDAGKQSGWIADRVGKAIERELKMILSQPVRVNFLAEEVCGFEKQAVSTDGGDVDGDNDRSRDHVVRQGSKAISLDSPRPAPVLV